MQAGDRVQAEEPHRAEDQVRVEDPHRAGDQVQAEDPHRVGDRVRAEVPHRAGNRVQGEEPHQAGDLEQAEDPELAAHQNLHFVQFLVHKQDQLKDLEYLRHLLPQQRVLVEEERLVLMAPHRQPLHLRGLHK